MADMSNSWTWYDGEWREGNQPIMGPLAHGFWLASSVFDGARAFKGVMPDLDLHCARINNSAKALGLAPTMKTEEIMELAKEGVNGKFGAGAAVYIRPTYWANAGLSSVIVPDPKSTDFCLTLFEAPMPGENDSTNMTTTSYRRPTIECMPTNAKAACLYANNARFFREAEEKGFDNAIVCDMLGNVAELASANVFLVKDGVYKTPAANGTYLAGITRARLLNELRQAGETAIECTLTIQDFRDADEVFSSGNYSKVFPITKFDDREYEIGPKTIRARELYMDFAFK